MKSYIRTIIWLILFSIAMGYMESAVVIYLRKIYYPAGFHFPLVTLDASIELVELFREAATIIMLLAIGILTAKSASLRFAHFILCFAIWDLSYYLFLRIFLGWPQSLLIMDILFLIPVPWVGPVIAPCIVSITMMILAVAIIHFQRNGINTRLKSKEWVLFTGGSIIVILSFMWEYLQYIQEKKSMLISDGVSDNQQMFSYSKEFVPIDFNWGVFITGEVVLIATIIVFITRIKRLNLLSDTKCKEHL